MCKFENWNLQILLLLINNFYIAGHSRYDKGGKRVREILFNLNFDPILEPKHEHENEKETFYISRKTQDRYVGFLKCHMQTM